MKRISLILLCALLLLALGCGNENKEPDPTQAPAQAPTQAPTEVPVVTQAPTEPPTPEPTEVPTPESTATPEPTAEPTPTPTPAPSGDPAVLKADNIGLLAGTAKEGDVLEILGEEGDYYLVNLDGETAFIYKKMVKLEGEAAFNEWKGYAQKGAVVNDSPYMDGKNLKTLSRNAGVIVKADLGDVLLVEAGGKTGYMHLRDVSKSKIKSSGSSSSGGSSGGGSTGNDGDDIELSNRGTLGGIVRLSSTSKYPTSGTVLVEGAELYYCIMSSGQPLTVLPADGENKGMKAVLYNGYVGAVPEDLVRMDSDKPFEQWTGYAKADAKAYETYRKLGDVKELDKNTEITVTDQIGKLYVVKIGGKTYFMEGDDISKTKLKSSSKGSGGSSSGGGDEWTDPVL